MSTLLLPFDNVAYMQFYAAYMSAFVESPYTIRFKCTNNKIIGHVYTFVVFTQGPGSRASGANAGGMGNMGTSNGNNPNGIDKSRTQPNPGDMSSTGWRYPPSMNGVKSTTNLSNIAILSIWTLVVLLYSL